jgi:aldehyde:ferredoxin oxidoreductase
MAKGYNGKVLFVDLTSGSIKEESLPEKLYREFIGWAQS